MFSTIKDFVLNFKFNELLGILLYWVPFAMCSVGYLLRGIESYRSDLKNRYEKFYKPTLTVGVIVGAMIIIAVPVANLWTAVVRFMPTFIGDFFDYLGKALDIPLVPKKAYKKPEANNGE